MAHTGQQIYNPVTGERITFLKTTAETGGALLEFECRVNPGGAVLPPHRHQTQEERFEILSGKLGVLLGGKRQVLESGDTITLPAGVVHQWWVAGDEEVAFRVEVAPARNLEAVLESICGMAQAGKLNKRVMPRNPFMLAQFGRMSETYLPVIPIWMQRIGLSMGSLTGQILGYDPTFAKYRASDAPEGALVELA